MVLNSQLWVYLHLQSSILACAEMKASQFRIKYLLYHVITRHIFNSQLLSYIYYSFRNKESHKSHFLILVKGDKLLPVSVDMIACFYIADGTVHIKLYNGKENHISQTLDELTEIVDPKLFFRTNCQYLISRNAIDDIDLWFNNSLSVNLKLPFSEKILISKMKVSEFKYWFSNGI